MIYMTLNTCMQIFKLCSRKAESFLQQPGLKGSIKYLSTKCATYCKTKKVKNQHHEVPNITVLLRFAISKMRKPSKLLKEN